MPFGKTARIQQADRQFGKHLNQIKKICENELSRETKCIEEVFKLEMLQHEFEFQESLTLLRRIQHVSHRRDAVLKRSFERILERFSFSSVYDSEMTLPPVQGIPRHKLPPRTAPAKLNPKSKPSSSSQPKHQIHSAGAKSNPLRMNSKITNSWKKIKITLPRCENEMEPAASNERRNPFGLLSNEASTTSLLGLARRSGRRTTQSQDHISRFMLPACLATKPMPRAKDRYLEAMQNKVQLCDIRECSYLRISADLRAKSK